MCTEPAGRSEGTPSELGAAWTRLAAAVSAVDAALGKWLSEEYRIGLSEYRAALQLSEAADRELRITELAHRIGLDLSSTTRLVSRMEAKELVVRNTCPHDGRGVYAVATDRGVDAVRRIRGAYEAKISELLRDAAGRHSRVDLRELAGALRAVGGFVAENPSSTPVERAPHQPVRPGCRGAGPHPVH
ncbi:MAG: MarR family transcriptional regulator [Pseudoclavibacter sp.]|nr:MarR family transcriptional regulator [Pseudoclavibacter sp.]